MSNKRFVLWKWAKPSKIFDPVENRYCEKGIRFKSYNKIVYAGLNPTDWMDIMGAFTLHKIVLDKQQAELCVVAEDYFRPTDKELAEFIERTHGSYVGSLNDYRNKNYKSSFVPLIKYSGGYNRPEVLIPFSVKTETVSCVKAYILIWKLKKWFTQKMKKRPSKIGERSDN